MNTISNNLQQARVRFSVTLRAFTLMLGMLLSLSYTAKSYATTFVSGDIYVYTAPGVLTDVTAEYHEDPIILINGVQVQIYPNYSNGNVYDANGDVLGFVYGVVQAPPP